MLKISFSMIIKTAFLLAVFFIFASLQFQENVYEKSDSSWVNLFNGKDLKGWKLLNGNAEYQVRDGQIIGISRLNTPNSFLCTDKMYNDFILEFDVWIDPELNSGVQFRSNSRKEYQDGRVHGYQFEIDPSPRAFSGGIYDEARRGWLYPLSRNTKAMSAFRNGQWNKCRIEALGTTIKTWINGVQCSRITDDITPAGFIGLQVHSIGDKSLAGKEIRWKDIRIKTQDLEDDLWSPDPEVVELSFLKNKLSDYEQRKGWRLLWDGKTSSGWRGAKLDHFPEMGWEIKEGILSILGNDGAESAGPGDIVTDDLFSDFELELEFMITEGANSGIKYFVDAALNKGEGSAIGCEFQILDDSRHPDAEMGVKGNRTLGSLYDLIPAENLSVPGRDVQFKGIGQWNTARILSENGHIEHWLNNEKIVEYERHSQIFKALVAYSKYKDWNGFGQWPEGHILLQDHGNTVHFRSIKIREF